MNGAERLLTWGAVYSLPWSISAIVLWEIGKLSELGVSRSIWSTRN
jgi:hypothetical protein